MEIAGYGLTDVGSKRTHNEDFMAYDDGLGLYVVCDGMGGAEAGEIAAERAVTTVHQVVRDGIASIADGAGGVNTDAMVALLRTAIETACAAVWDEAQTDIAKKGMGCTCISVLVAGGKAVMGHVGDSRLYLCRAGAVTQLSEDHTFINEAVKQGVFTPEEAAECGYKNVITRAIGKERNVIVDTLVFDLVLGDTLLLCSDGLHGYTKDNAELAQLLSVPSAEAIPLRLVQIANERGGQDNITALIVRPKAANEAEAQRSGDVIRGIEALKNIDLMKQLTMAEIVRFKQIFYEAYFAAGEVIVREGEVNDNLFVIVLGSAEVLR
ncbi:MAG TPA: protein phosphatase 2C domain-containing protein, partial [Planctomycetota bacterium]|nr:protein phosphatase 2C domain-containing protein [Planctomycetota bacterium]